MPTDNMTPKPLPPLAEVFAARVARIRAIHDETNLMAALEISTVSYCAQMSAPYDAELARLRALLREVLLAARNHCAAHRREAPDTLATLRSIVNYRISDSDIQEIKP